MVRNIKIILIKLLLLNFSVFNINLYKKRGFRSVLKNKNLSLLRKIKSQMLDVNFSDQFYGDKIKNLEFKNSLIQYLNDNLIFANSNFLQLLFYYFGKKKNFIYPLPKKWIRVLCDNGIKINIIGSRILWAIYVLSQYFKGFLLFIKIIFSALIKQSKIFNFNKNKRIPNLNDKNFSIFVGDTPKDLGFGINNYKKLIKISEVQSLVHWYKKNNTDDYIIATSVYNEDNNYFDQYAFLKNNYDYLLTEINIFKLTFDFLKIQIKILSNLSLLKWGYAILHEELIISQIFSYSKKVPKNIFFYWYANTYKPLWVIELEKRKSTISIYLKSSINSLSESNKIYKKNENYNDYDFLGYKINNWKNYLVWHPAIENILRKNIKIINKVTHVNINPYEGYYHNLKQQNEIIIPSQSFSVFPFSDTKGNYGISRLSEYFYNDKELLNNFLQDIYEILSSNNIKMVIKMKKKKENNEYKRDLKIFEKYRNNNEIIFLNSELPVYNIASLTLGSISMPFSSTALIAKKANKPSIYYDTSNFVDTNDVYNHGIDVLKNSNELSKFIKNLK